MMKKTQDIIKAVENAFDIPWKVVIGKRRTRELSRIRDIAASLIQEHTFRGHHGIARALGGRDRTTVTAALKRHAARLSDPKYEAMVDAVRDELEKSNT